jgi:hypothetical protein
MRSTERTTAVRTASAVAALLLLVTVATAGCNAAAPTGVTSSPSIQRGAASGAVPLGAPQPFGTGPGTSAGAGSVPAPSSPKDAAVTSPPGTATGVEQTLIVVNKTLRLEVGNVDSTLAKIRSLASRDGGDISDMQVSTSVDQPVYPPTPVPLDQSGAASTPSDQGGPLQAYVTVRVPTAHYQAFIADAAKLGRVIFQSETAQDVTQQHVDMKARLDNLKAEETRLRQLFARARTVSEMLAVEQELTRVQGDIESMQAQIDYLEKQAALATVTIQIAEPKPIVRPVGTDWGTSDAVTNSIRAFVGTLNVLIVVLGPVLALLIFVALPVFLVTWLIVRGARRRRARRAGVAASNEPPVSDGGADAGIDAS